ncbi:Large extracellular alpha-helical protein [Polaromonas sp. CG9_12]|nr:Large extracellular alpha-helical protein [Polaromonas sp. CG9_12]
MGLSAPAALQAQMLHVLSLSPQVELAQVRQPVVKFNEAAVNFGDPKAPAPFTLRCSNAQASEGTDRWTRDRQWALAFDQDLPPPGTNCAVTAVSGFKSGSDALLTCTSSYKFNSIWPFMQNLRPGRQQPIDEAQYFVQGSTGRQRAAHYAQGQSVGRHVLRQHR